MTDLKLTEMELASLLAEEGLLPVRDVIEDRPWSTISRWIRHGCGGVKLEAVRDGGLWRTSKAAVTRFRARCTGKSSPTPRPRAGSTEKRVEAANATIGNIGRKKVGGKS